MRSVEGTITDRNMDALLAPSSREVLEAIPTLPDIPEVKTLDEYQSAAAETAMYPRVYVEDQVGAMLEEALREFGISDIAIEATIRRLLNKYETPFNRLVYPILGLLGEAGELANKLKKVARDDQGQMDMDRSTELVAELGDNLWYVAAVATELNTPLERVAFANVRKLFSRKARGVLGGDGDNR